MATERVVAVLERSDPSNIKSLDSSGAQEGGEGEVMINYLKETRQKHKLMLKQLCVLDDMLKFLSGLESVEQFLNEPSPPNPGNEAYAAWKSLKAEYQEQVQKVDGLIVTLCQCMTELHDKRQKLELLMVTLEKKDGLLERMCNVLTSLFQKEECKEKERIAARKKQRAENHMSQQLEESMEKARNTLNVCNRRLSELKCELDTQLARMADMTCIRDRLKDVLEITQAVSQHRLLSFSPTELCLELLPRSTKQSLQPLRVSVTKTSEDVLQLQVFQGTTGLSEESVEGPVRELSFALLDIMQRYITQGEMLAEVQSLHSRFAIDWCPAKRLLIFLKSATTVCHLELDEGYPSSGRARLRSVHKDGSLLDLNALQPSMENPALTNWLEFLTSCPDL